jgi:arginine N-succinyltransferase
MILLREVQERDLEALYRFSQIPGFINLTSDRVALQDKIRRSRLSFSDQLANKMEGKYLFVAEDLESGMTLGTSMIAAQHGTVESPHFYFEVGSEQKFSKTINTGLIHGTLKLKYDNNGPSEIGGLVLDPERRNSEDRLGRQLSFVRFLYLGLNRSRFKRKLLAELLPPLNQQGQSPLWEAIGRRFTNMDYWEADQLCQKNKEFILSLFPSGKIYTTFLPAEARHAIGKVGSQTEPVLHMLTKIGFGYRNQVDPFDGGPHLWAAVDELLPIRKLVPLSLTTQWRSGPSPDAQMGLLAPAQLPLGQFRAISVPASVEGGRLVLDRAIGPAIQSALQLSEGQSVAFMPYY